MNTVDLYTRTASEASRLITQKYSTSFSTAMRLLDEPVRTHLYNTYGYVRVADELVDTLRPKNASMQLDSFIEESKQALTSGVSLNPVIHAFTFTAKANKIPADLVEAFFVSMRMDLSKRSYGKTEYAEYIYGSAEVVGLMCLCIFTQGNKSQYTKLKSGAQALGSAFQKINFLRDIAADSSGLGRIYFPSIDFKNFTEAQKQELINEMRAELTTAKAVIPQLPRSSRYGVSLAFNYYSALVSRLDKASVDEVKNSRLRVNDAYKVYLFCLVGVRKLLHI